MASPTYPDAYTSFAFVDSCGGMDIEAEIDDLKERVDELEEIVQNPQDVYV